MTKRLFLLFFPIILMNPCVGQQESVEEFIISVTSNYKNPLAYYPLRRDIFLPTDEELNELERDRDKPENAIVMGSFVFMNSDSSLQREPFIDAQGDLMFSNTRYRGLSQRASFAYHKRRQRLLMRQNNNVGRFLWYNEQFKKLR